MFVNKIQVNPIRAILKYGDCYDFNGAVLKSSKILSFGTELSNPLLYNKISVMSKLKAFEDDKVSVTQNIKFVFYRVGNIAGKDKNYG